MYPKPLTNEENHKYTVQSEVYLGCLNCCSFIQNICGDTHVSYIPDTEPPKLKLEIKYQLFLLVPNSSFTNHSIICYIKKYYMNRAYVVVTGYLLKIRFL